MWISRRKNARARLARLLEVATRSDTSWYRTDALNQWRVDVENGLVRAFGRRSPHVMQFRAVRWSATDDDATEIEQFEAFQLAVGDCLTILSRALGEEETPGRIPWPTIAGIVLVVALIGVGVWRVIVYVRKPVDVVSPPPPKNRRFKIIQLSALSRIEGLERGATGGLARVRELRRLAEADGVPTMIVNTGNTLFPSVMKKYLGPEPMTATLNLLDGSAIEFDDRMVATFGNHDVVNQTHFRRHVAMSRFRWVGTNLETCAGVVCQPISKDIPEIPATQLLDVGGIKVGVLGVMLPLDRQWIRSKDPIKAAKEAAAALRRQGAQVVIALTHQDWEDDLSLARSTDEIDVVVGGRDQIYQAADVNGHWVTRVDADARSVLVFDVTLPAVGRPAIRPLPVLLDKTTEPDAVVAAEVFRWHKRLQQELGGDTVVGLTHVELEGREPTIRTRETALGNLLADAAREQMQTDVAFIGSGGIRLSDDIPAGPVTSADLEGVFYFSNRLVACELTGAQLLAVLRNSVSRVDYGDGRFLQVSGLRFSYRKDGVGSTVSTEDVMVGGAPLDLKRRYTIATTDYLYDRGPDDGYTVFSVVTRPPRIKVEREADFRAVVEKVIARGPIQTAVGGRIVRIK